eukprot:scaffold75562_cov33-Tisochrysis_lutea.AAC.5
MERRASASRLQISKSKAQNGHDGDSPRPKRREMRHKRKSGPQKTSATSASLTTYGCTPIPMYLGEISGTGNAADAEIIQHYHPPRSGDR